MPEKASRITSIHMPARTAAHRLRAPGGDVQCRLAHGAAHGQPLVDAGGDVAGALSDEVSVGIGTPAAGVGGRLTDAGALDQHDGRDRQRAGDQPGGQKPEIGERRQGEAAGNVAGVLDPGDAGARGQDHDRGDDQRHERAEHRQAPAPGGDRQ